ncbi:MAG: hypothetical protein WD768_06120, partial [Phycisphaeraceae bacterium]
MYEDTIDTSESVPFILWGDAAVSDDTRKHDNQQLRTAECADLDRVSEYAHRPNPGTPSISRWANYRIVGIHFEARWRLVKEELESLFSLGADWDSYGAP